MTKKKKKMIIGLVIGLVVVIIVVLNITRSSEKSVTVQAEKVKTGSIASTVSAAGKIQPETEVDISANVSGKIVRMGVQEGDPVERGQFLVQLDRNRYQALVDQAQAQLASADARLVEAEAEYRRVKQLFDAGLSSEADLEAVAARKDVEEANHKASKAYLEKAQDDLSKTTITAPMSGTVSQLNSEAGEVVLGTEQFSGTVIMTIADLSRMEAEADVDETDIVDVHIGQAASIEVDALPDSMLKGKVTEIASSAYTLGRGTQEEVTNFKVKVAILDRVSSLRPGMSATVDIETASHEDVLYIPIQSVVMRSPASAEEEEKGEGGEDVETTAGEGEADPGDSTESAPQVTAESSGTGESGAEAESDPDEEPSGRDEKKEELIEVVFVVRDDVAVMVPVETGISSDTDTEIVSGLEGEEMVVTGSYRALRDLQDGQKVEVENPDQGPEGERR
jgi:HlyD family secretion protein